MTGNMGYYIMPKAIATLCDTAPRADASSCFGIFHGSKGLRVNVRGYYRRRTCSWYRGCSVSEEQQCSFYFKSSFFFV